MLTGNGWFLRCVIGLFIQGDVRGSTDISSCRKTPTVTGQSNKWQKCDRGNPCSICTITGADCLQGNFMTYVFGTKRLSQPLTRENPSSPEEEEAAGFTLASHVGQNQDGTWTSTQQTQLWDQRPKKRKAEGPPMPLTKRRGRPRSTAVQKNENVSNFLEDTSDKINNGMPSSSDMFIMSRQRVQKRKYDDKDNEDFISGPADHGTVIQRDHSFDMVPVGSLKRNATANKTAGFIKYHRSMQEDKPAPYGQPPVWADKRQSLCETLPYYRAYMSGAYMHLQTVRAFMVDKEVGPRDKFAEEIMISRV